MQPIPILKTKKILMTTEMKINKHKKYSWEKSIV